MFKVGDKVRMRDNDEHYHQPMYYPDYTVVGEIIEMDGAYALVDWGKDSGVLLDEITGKYAWYVDEWFITKTNID